MVNEQFFCIMCGIELTPLEYCQGGGLCRDCREFLLEDEDDEKDCTQGGKKCLITVPAEIKRAHYVKPAADTSWYMTDGKCSLIFRRTTAGNAHTMCPLITAHRSRCDDRRIWND